MSNSINTIVSSTLAAVKVTLAHIQENNDPLAGKDITSEAKAILSGIPTSKKVDFATYLVDKKGFTADDLSAAGAAIAVMEDSTSLITDLLEGDDKSLDQYTAGAEADSEIVDYLKTKLLSEYAPAKAEEGADNAKSAKASGPSVDANMAAAIDSLLSVATQGNVKSINALLNENTSLQSDLTTAKQELTDALMKARSVPVPATGTTTTAMGDLTYDVVYKKASDVFKFGGRAANSKGLAFDIPTLVWKDDKGTVVQHPETPSIDPNYNLDPLKVLMFLTGVNRNMNTWLYGHTGTGKSTFVEQIAAHMGWPVSRVNLDSNLERADLVGHVTLTEENGTTVSTYEEGILPRAMQRPGFLLMDEIDAGRPDILFVVQRALENKGLMLTEDKGRIVQPHPLFRFTATANTRGQGDEYGMYAGTRAMNASMIDRFTAFIQFDYMKPKEETDLLTKLVPAIDKGMAQKMAQFASEVRTAFSKGEVYNTISPRGLSVLADCYATFTGLGSSDELAFQMAMDMSVLNKVTNDTKQKFIELASRVFGFAVKSK